MIASLRIHLLKFRPELTWYASESMAQSIFEDEMYGM